MVEKKRSYKKGLLYSVLFFLVSNQSTYNVVNSFVGALVQVVNDNGCPTSMGVLLHSVIFFFIVYEIVPRLKEI
jgi:hypothetical protein